MSLSTYQKGFSSLGIFLLEVFHLCFSLSECFLPIIVLPWASGILQRKPPMPFSFPIKYDGQTICMTCSTDSMGRTKVASHYQTSVTESLPAQGN